MKLRKKLFRVQFQRTFPLVDLIKIAHYVLNIWELLCTDTSYSETSLSSLKSGNLLTFEKVTSIQKLSHEDFTVVT
jgi:hypothetical protein